MLILIQTSRPEDVRFPFAALQSLACCDTELREVEFPPASTPVKSSLCKAFCELWSCQCQMCGSEQRVFPFVRADAVVTGLASPEPPHPGHKRVLRLEKGFAGCLLITLGERCCVGVRDGRAPSPSEMTPEVWLFSQHLQEPGENGSVGLAVCTMARYCQEEPLALVAFLL